MKVVVTCSGGTRPPVVSSMAPLACAAMVSGARFFVMGRSRKAHMRRTLADASLHGIPPVRARIAQASNAPAASAGPSQGGTHADQLEIPVRRQHGRGAGQ